MFDYSFFSLLSIFFLFTSTYATPLAEHFQTEGYVEICNQKHGAKMFDALYVYFDEMLVFLQNNPAWIHKLDHAKKLFIRSKDKELYSTDFFSLYDESTRNGRGQISFYYSSHFHEFICSYYKEFNQIPEITDFFQACLEIHKSYVDIFKKATTELHLETLLSLNSGSFPILLKIIKYLPSYTHIRPHYDGSAFSLFLDSTDNQSLLLSPYKTSFSVNDFASPTRLFSREFDQSSMLLIPGTLLTEFSIYPTPHIVLQSGNIRYATIAFAMRPNHIPKKIEYPSLPRF